MKSNHRLLLSIILSILVKNEVYSQQNLVSGQDITSPIEEGFKIFGAGNVNTQSLSQIAAGGKVAFSIVPLMIDIPHSGGKKFITSSYLTFNANASNNDTLLQGNILFPDLGNASFNGTLETGILTSTFGHARFYYGLFGEFSYKKIVAKDSSQYFNALNYSCGLKGTYYFQQGANDNLFSFTGLLYYNYTHIPDKDTVDYRILLKEPNLSNSINSIGFKVTVGINYLQIFADFRHGFYNSIQNQPLDRGLYSFNSNIGIILPVEIKATN